ncbi:hypothetical protein [Streptomyces sp. NPDC057910]|uniref:hypothetical protein n=1 Tax=Streptomyces sp. NPDC057910 TaxID=3346278 RepID=UPI0036EEECE7
MASLVGDDGSPSGISPSWSYGVWGDSGSGSGTGVTGSSNGGAGVAAPNSGAGNGAGLFARNYSYGTVAFLAVPQYAAALYGDMYISGTLSKSGGGFLIDHPRRPAESFLSHSCVESSERKNIYDGIAVAGADGRAVVELPDWFGEVNTEFRYQLTAIGAAAPDLHVAEEVRENRFVIGGASAGGRVSWQVTGVRQDAWAKANPLTIEEDKPEQERGHYFHPELYGSSEQESIFRARHPH